MNNGTGDTQPTLFELPTVPDVFGLVLPQASLRRIDFSGLDYNTALRAIVEYIKTYYPNRFNDFTASNGYMMLCELIAAAVGKLSLRADILANEAFITTASTEEAVVNHLTLINQQIRRQTPAVVEIQCIVTNPTYTDIQIPAGTTFNVRGANNTKVTYELYRAPGDYQSNIVIPAGKRGVIGIGIQGSMTAPVQFVSDGSMSQVYTISAPTMLDEPLYCRVANGNISPTNVGEAWTVILEPIERYGPLDKVVEATFFGARTSFRFGNNVNGVSPVAGQIIQLQYRVGGGVLGRIGVGQINESRQLLADPPANSPIQVTFSNPAASSGGTDKESLDAAKQRAPRDYASRGGIVTSQDYANAAQSFAHPAFGSVAKAVATLRSDINANLVEVYCLAIGSDGTPAIPNAGLKAGLKTFYEQRNVLTDTVVILDGKLKPVDVTMTVVINVTADATVVKTLVEQALDDFFNFVNWEMGMPLYTSNLIDTISDINGVSYVDLYAPSDNLLPGRADGVLFNELIVEGKRAISYYYEKVTH